MRTRSSRVALGAALSVIGALLLASCGGRQGIEERRRQNLAESEPAAEAPATEVAQAPADTATDDGSGLELASAPAGDAGRAGANGGGQDSRDEDDLDDLLGDEPLGDDDDDARAPIRPRAATSARSSGSGASAADVLDDMRRELDAEEAEAVYFERKGDEAMDSGRYEDAEMSYQRAVQADPSRSDLVKKLHRAQYMLGKRSGEVGVLAEDTRAQETVRREQLLTEIDRNLDGARRALEERSIDAAFEQATLAADKIALDPELAGEDRGQQARELLDRIRKERNSLEAQARQEQLLETQERADLELDQQRERREERVQDLLRKSLEAIRRGQYRKVEELCTTVLDIEPDNKVAAYWLRSARERMLKERQLAVIQDRIENRKLLQQNFIEATIPYESVFVFPEDEYWLKVRQRREALKPQSVLDPEPVRRMKAALESTRIEVEFEDSPLKDVVDHFKSVVGINIIVSADVDAEEIRITQAINQLPANNALNLILRAHGLGYVYDEGILKITSADEARPETTFEVYNVSDLLFKVRDFAAPELRLKSANEDQGGAPISFTDDFAEETEELDPESLIELIQESSGGEDVWDGEINTINHQRGQLFVKATRELHRQVRNVLDNLRQDSDLYVVIEARFIDITDDFLEDIGIDSRDLSDQNWDQFVPFGGDINDSSTGGNDLGLVEQGSEDDNFLVAGLDRWAGRVQHIIDGFTGTIQGERLNAGGGVGGGSFQASWLEPFQVNVILRAVQEKQDARQLTAPVVTAHNNERVYVSVITQRAYIADYELVSGGTGFAIIEVADPVVATFQEGVILDVDPTISHDKKYVTLDVKPTLATLIGGIISTINISLGSFTNVAFQVPIGIPQISLQQSFTSVTVPNGGTVLLGGFKGMQEGKFNSYLPILGKIPILKNLVRRKATIREKRSLVILLTARIVDLRGEEERKYNPQ